MSVLHYEDSLRRFVQILRSEGDAFVMAGVFLRDASGRLSFFADEDLDEERQSRLADAAAAALGSYAQSDRLVVSAQEVGSRRIRQESCRRIVVDGLSLRYVDRRIVGADWLREPAPAHKAPARVVFSSLKGGVGRTTAISIVAAHLAASGRNVLVVDLDLEAPGIGSMLLPPGERVPMRGSLDFLVESNLRKIEPREREDFVGTSDLTMGNGLVEVVPVWGRASELAPEHYLEKLSRAMVEEITPTGDVVPLAGKIAALLDYLEARRPYDVVLIDARAGLSELTAGPLLALGATVLLFGSAQRQTLEGYRFLFAHLASLDAKRRPSPWEQLKVVHAKAAPGMGQRRQFQDEMWELFSTYLYEEQEGADLESFNFVADDPVAPHVPIVIPLDTKFVDWDPVGTPERLRPEYYGPDYAELTEFVDRLLETS